MTASSTQQTNAGAVRDMANAIRALAMDAVQAANSGHPGMPMGMAEIAVALWSRHLRHDPADPRWPDRDRFVLSNGHGSMLLYALLHLSGYDLPIEELKRFRQFGSKTPGHPEYGCAPGVETTTGPLGQGLANAVGMAIAERALAAQFNRAGHAIVDHRTYAFAGDGCLMEGVSHEACSLAGTLGLGKLIVLYDDNRISIDSEKASMDLWFTDDTARRFEAYGWRVIANVDGHDVEAVDRAIRTAHESADRPVLIACKTVIAKGSPKKANTGAAHGSPLGAEEIDATRKAIGWPHGPFVVPAEVAAHWNARERGAGLSSTWRARLAAYAKAHPDLAGEFERRMRGELPADYAAHYAAALADVCAKKEKIATRKASQNAIEALAPKLPELIGGSADLAGSNLTLWKGAKGIARISAGNGGDGNGGGNYLYYGVREFGMCAVMNGLSLHGGFIPYGGTFLVFSDYARNALRVAALMKARAIYVFTHDSIGLGEDGPTHQPVEHAASLRIMPNMDVWRPCDPVETLASWNAAIRRNDGPTSLLLTRQNVTFHERDAQAIENIARGGYVLADSAGAPQVVLIATGSEVDLAVGARGLLEQQGVRVRVVSMPCTEAFDRQPAAYRDAVLPRGVPRVAIEAGVTDGWRKYVGLEGAVVGIDRFGESAPAPELFKHFGFTPDNVANVARKLLGA